MANPVFSQSKEFNGESPRTMHVPNTTMHAPQPSVDYHIGDPFNEPSTPTGMTLEGTITKAFGFFLLAVASAVIVGMFIPQLTLIVGIAAFVMSLVVSFSKGGPKPALYAVTLALYGGTAGGLSVFYESAYTGIILQALVGTACVFVTSLLVYRSGRVRNMAKIRKFLMIAIPAYVIFSLVNFVIVLFGGSSVLDANIPGTSIPWGLLISIFAIGVGALMLISDFDFVDNGVRKSLPAQWEWTAAYGLVFSIVWIYMEMLRFLSYLRR